MTPWPGKWGERMRAGFFYDAGNVFSTGDVLFEEEGRRLNFGFDASELRRSLGVAVDVLLPLGRVRLSYAVPLNANEDHPSPALHDRVERFQVSVGIDF
jgi:outer membrane protein assembly factor BamA